MASRASSCVQIPVDLLVSAMDDPAVHTTLLSMPEFRRWMLDYPEFTTTLLKNKVVAKYISDMENEFWNECLTSLRSTPTCQSEPDSTSPDSTTSFQPSSSPSQCPVVKITTKSKNADATSKIGTIETSDTVHALTESEHGDCSFQLDKLTIKENDKGCRSQPKCVISSQSTKGKAHTEVKSIVLADAVQESHTSYSFVGDGVAVVNSKVGKGIYVNTSPKVIHSDISEAKPEEKNTITTACDAVPFPNAYHNPSTIEATSKRTPSFLPSIEEVEKEIRRLTPGSSKNSAFVNAVVSRKGDAVLTAKKMEIDVQDSEKNVLAFCKSDEKDAIMNIGEISVKTSKPRKDEINYNIGKLVGSLFLQNEITSSVSNCQGEVNLMGTNIESDPDDKVKDSSSKVRKTTSRNKEKSDASPRKTKTTNED